MADWHRMRAKYWPDMRGTSDRGKLLGTYILTCKHRVTEGLYYLPVGYIADDLGWTTSVAKKAIAELEERGFITYDHEAQVVLIPKALAYPDQVPKTENHIKGALKELAHVPPSPLQDRFLQIADEYAPLLAEAIRNYNPSASHG